MSWLPSCCRCCCECPVDCTPPTLTPKLASAPPPTPTLAPETATVHRIVTAAEFNAAVGNNPLATSRPTHRHLASTDMMEGHEFLNWSEASYNKYIRDRAQSAKK